MKLMIYTFFFMLSASLFGCDVVSGTNIIDQKLQSGEPYFSAIFTREFAERFSLPASRVADLGSNLKAIGVEINKVNFRYTCDLHLYVDDQLDLYFPEDGRYYTLKPEAEYFFANYNKQDIEFNSYVGLNHMRVRFDSTKQVEPEFRFTRTLSYTRVHRSFLPGLTIVTLNTHCGIFNRAYYPAVIWIQRQQMGDYLVGNDGREELNHPEKNHRFVIPLELIEQIQPYIKIAEKHNREKLNEEFGR